MLMVQALAGTGKTTTAIFGLGMRVPKGIVLSEEQKGIIKLMRSFKWNSCAAQAYNTTIADELKRRVPPGVNAATSNAFGYRAWLQHIGLSRIKVDGLKNRKIFRELADHLSFKERVELEGSVDRLVGLCKNYVMLPTRDNFNWLCDRFDIEANEAVFDYAEQVFNVGVNEKEFFDFDDQNFMPLHYDIEFPKYDLVLVDEVQDLTRAKQEVAFRMTKDYLVAIGDKHQAIYGFAGADADAMDTMWTRMKDISSAAETLPLTITRRCPKAVVARANRWVPELKAAPEAPEGSLVNTSEREWVDKLMNQAEGEMVLCRVNAPLTSLAFRLIARNRRCYIQGRDIGNGLKRDIKAVNEHDLRKAMVKVQEKIEKRIDTLKRKAFPDNAKIEALRDRAVCMQILADSADTVEEYCNHVDMLFKDKGSPNDIQLSSVHKAKGLEHPRVSIYKPSKLPLKIKQKPGGPKRSIPKFHDQQEKNLAYVADTRSMDTLTIVAEEKERDDIFADLCIDADGEDRTNRHKLVESAQSGDPEPRWS